MQMLRKAGYAAITSIGRNGGGRYSWSATTKARWRRFADFCESKGVSDIQNVSLNLIQSYATEILSRLAVATAQNCVSAINVVMKRISSDWVSLSPRKIVGRSRSAVRKKPIYFFEEDIKTSIDSLLNKGFHDLAAVVFLAANFGLRRRECALADLTVFIKEARKSGLIDIVNGTKGGRGRCIERYVRCDGTQLEFLEQLDNEIGGRRSLIPEGMNYQQFSNRVSNICLPILKINGISRLHDLRAFYASRRFSEITGCVAPCNRIVGSKTPDSQQDLEARETISNELGHSRPQITSSYVGRKDRRGKKNE